MPVAICAGALLLSRPVAIKIPSGGEKQSGRSELIQATFWQDVPRTWAVMLISVPSFSVSTSRSTPVLASIR